MLTLQLLLVTLPVQTPGEAEMAPPSAPMAAEPEAAEVAPTAAELEASGMPSPTRSAAPAVHGELRGSPAARPATPPPPPDATPYGQLRGPPPPRLQFVGVTPYVDGNAVSLLAFYAEMGRYDLVEEYYASKRLKRGLLIGGAAGVGVASVGFFVGYFLWLMDIAELAISSTSDTNLFDVFTDRGSVVMLVSVGVGLAGLLCAAFGIFMDPEPMSPGEARALYDRTRSGQAVGPVSWRLTPVVTDGGGGMALGLSF